LRLLPMVRDWLAAPLAHSQFMPLRMDPTAND
jgi:hypothetical protein